MSRIALRAWTALVFLFLFAPIVMVVLMSFSGAKYSTFPIPSWTLRWYGEAFGDEKIIAALQNSVLISLVSATLATALGTLAALGLVRNRLRLKETLKAFFLSPLIVPEIITGIALLSFATLLHLQGGLSLVVIGHVLIGLPFALTVVSARLYGFDRSLEEAAMDLGADRLRTFRRVTLPLMMPGVLGGFLLAFTVSFDNFLITYLLSGSQLMTIPVHIYSMIRFEFTPKIHAVSTVIVFISICIVLLGQQLSARKAGA